MKSQTIEHIAMFVVKSIVIQINGKVYESFNRHGRFFLYPMTVWHTTHRPSDVAWSIF